MNAEVGSRGPARPDQNSKASFTLSEAIAGDRLRIVALASDESRRRLLGMGIAPGAVLDVMTQTTPGAVVIALNHQRLGLGIELAQQIQVQPEAAPRRSRSDTPIPTVQLRTLAVGSQAQVIGYEKQARAYRRKLLAMGLTKGTAFTVTRRAPLGDPIELKVRGFSLSLRKDEADALLVNLLSDATREKVHAC